MNLLRRCQAAWERKTCLSKGSQRAFPCSTEWCRHAHSSAAVAAHKTTIQLEAGRSFWDGPHRRRSSSLRLLLPPKSPRQDLRNDRNTEGSTLVRVPPRDRFGRSSYVPRRQFYRLTPFARKRWNSLTKNVRPITGPGWLDRGLLDIIESDAVYLRAT